MVFGFLLNVDLPICRIVGGRPGSSFLPTGPAQGTIASDLGRFRLKPGSRVTAGDLERPCGYQGPPKALQRGTYESLVVVFQIPISCALDRCLVRDARGFPRYRFPVWSTGRSLRRRSVLLYIIPIFFLKHYFRDTFT